MRRFVTAGFAALALCACGKERKGDEAATAASASAAATTASAVPSAVASASPSAELTDKDLPVMADFAAAVRKEITPANYKAQLEKVEKDVTTK